MSTSYTKKNEIYEPCSHIKKSKPDYHIDEAMLKEIGSNFRILPTFEKSLFDQVYIRHYSFNNNERLKCCWGKYVHNINTRVFAPFIFPRIRDLHFRNNAVQFVPSENKYDYDNTMKLKPGPGVDRLGQLPIPQELHMKRGGDTKRDNLKELDRKQIKKKKPLLKLPASRNKAK